MRTTLFAVAIDRRKSTIRTTPGTMNARRKDANANADDLEMEQMSKAELARLQRQYRIMEGDREAYSEEMKILLHKQQSAIGVLEKEKAEILRDLNYVKGALNELKTEKSAKKLKELLRTHDDLAREILRERTLGKELDVQIKRVEREAIDARQRSGERRSSREGAEMQERSRQQLENRLDVATVKLNRVLANNQSLREQIDHFLKERSLFKRSFEELSMRLDAGKKAIMDLTEQSTSAYDQREEAQGKLEALKQKGKQDVAVHGQEMKELQRKLDHDSKLQEFLGVKGQRRIMADLEAKEALKRQQQRESLELKIYHYRSLLEKIRNISDESDVDRLSAQFLKQEEENFALFNYVNELNNELEVIQEQLDEVNRSIQEQSALTEAKAMKKQAALESLAAELRETKTRSEATRRTLNECEGTNDHLFAGVRKAFEELRPDENPTLRLLGENVEATFHNVALYLGVIEKRAAHLSALVRKGKSGRT